MHVLITRPERDAVDLSSRITALGCQVTVAPLIEIALNPVAADALSGASGIIATSRNGLRALTEGPALTAARMRPLFVVGPGTAKLARSMGFAEIIEGPGTAADLVPVIVEHSAGRQGALVHLAGDHVAYDLKAALHSQGIGVRVIETYRSVAAETLPNAVRDQLAAGTIDAVILMSPRTAAVWSGLLSSWATPANLPKITHVCLSQAVADRLDHAADVRTVIAAQPHSDEIVALVYRLAGRAETG